MTTRGVSGVTGRSDSTFTTFASPTSRGVRTGVALRCELIPRELGVTRCGSPIVSHCWTSDHDGRGADRSTTLTFGPCEESEDSLEKEPSSVDACDGGTEGNRPEHLVRAANHGSVRTRGETFLGRSGGRSAKLLRGVGVRKLPSLSYNSASSLDLAALLISTLLACAAAWNACNAC